MAIIDQTRTWEPLEKRLAQTTNERHRLVLSTVIEHMKAEAVPDMDRLMATISPNRTTTSGGTARTISARRPSPACRPTTPRSSKAGPTSSSSR